MVDQNTNKSKSHIWNSLFENIISVLGIQLFCIRPHVSLDIIRVFLIFYFSSRKSQSQQRLVKKITHFTIQFRSKNLTHFTNLNSLDIENDTLSQHSQKLSHFTNFPANQFYKFYKFSVYFCIYPLENFSSRDVVRSYLVEVGRGVGERLFNFFKAACCLSLVKCFTIF